MNESTFGARLKKARKSKGYTQKELAALIDAKHNSISNWENDQNKPDPDTIERLCTVLDISADYLLPSRKGHFASPADQANLNQPKTAADTELSNRTLLSMFDVITDPIMTFVPVIGVVRAGINGLAFEEPLGREPAHISGRAEDHFYLKVVGDSMTPEISEGDLALVRIQPDAESGELVVAIIDEEEGTIKKLIKKPGALVLQAFNPAYPPRIFTGEEMNSVRIVGKVVRTVRIW